MGVVYEARQVSLNRPVALKMIKAGVLADDAEVQRFQNEAEAVALLDHPGIVPVYEVGEHHDQRYFSMKLIEGGNLAEQLASFRDNLGAAVALMIETAEAVQHAHTRGILHRDLKPANILIDAQGHPHITDFGLAKLIESDVELTASGAIMGTPAYMSPEQAAGHRGAITTATDVYGLGAILYAVLTGKAPFGGESVIETLDAVRNRLPEPPTRRNARIPRDLELICLKCLEKVPVDRYPTAGALAADLGRFAAGEPVSVRAAGAVERLAKWARRKPTLAAAYMLGLLTLLLGGLGGAAVWQWRTAARARDAAASARETAESARDGEATARAAAERARDGEATARAAAEKARDEVARAREKLAGVEYGRTMEVSHQEWRENNVAAAMALLESTPPELRGWEWRYLHHLCHSDLLTLKGQLQFVNAASFSPDGSRIITAGTDRTAKVWDASTGAVVLTFKGHTAAVHSASFSPDGSRIVTAGEDQTAKVWDARTGAVVRTLKMETFGPVDASFSPDGSRVVTTGLDNTTKVWDATSGEEVLTVREQTDHAISASFSPDGSRIVTGGDDGSAQVWDAATGAKVVSLKGHPGSSPHMYGVWSASFSPDGSRIVTGSNDATAKVWDARTGALVSTLKGHASQIHSASFSPDGSRIVTSSADRTAKVWDARTGALVLTLEGHTNFVHSASFSPDGSRIVTGSFDGTAKVWDAQIAAEFQTLKGETRGVVSASFIRDGSRLVTGSFDGSAKVWDAGTGADVFSLKGHAQRLISASPGPDGSRIVTASAADNTAKVWDATTGAEILTFKGKVNQFISPISPDGSRVVTGGWEMTEVPGTPSGVRFSTNTAYKTAKVWDVNTGAAVLSLEGHGDLVKSASFSPDGSRVVTASHDGTAKVWDARTGAVVRTLKGHNGPVFSASFSPDGLRVVAGGADATARVWDATTGSQVFLLKGHTFAVLSASFSPDGSRIVTGSQDSTAKVWDARSGAEVLTLKMGQGVTALSVSFSPDGARIATLAMGAGVKFWDNSPIIAKPSVPLLAAARRPSAAATGAPAVRPPAPAKKTRSPPHGRACGEGRGPRVDHG